MKLIKLPILLFYVSVLYNCKTTARELPVVNSSSSLKSSDKSNIEYKLLYTQENVDFDYKWLDKIDSVKVPYATFDGNKKFPIGDLKTIDGNYTIQRYYGEYMGNTSQGIKKIHVLLMLKVRGKEIIDAFHYNLSWQDSPHIVLFRLANIRNKNIKLTKELKLESFNFVSYKKRGKRKFNLNGFVNISSNNSWQSLTINVEELRHKGNFILFEPDRNVRKATYTTYYFNTKDVKKRFGSIKNIVNKKIMCLTGKKTQKRYINKHGENPSGGFKLVQIFCDDIK